MEGPSARARERPLGTKGVLQLTARKKTGALVL